MPAPRSFAFLLGLAAAGAACSRPAEPEHAAVAPTSVSIQVARLDAIHDTLVAPGNVVPMPASDWTVFAPETGRVAEMPKMEGEVVKAGDVLVRFDIASFSADVETGQLEVNQATAKLQAARTDFTKMSSLHDRGYTSRNDFEASKALVAAAESNLSRAKTLMDAAVALADRAVIKAKFDGVVAKRWHNEGDLVNAAMSDPVIRIIDPTRVQVAMQVSVGQLARITIGQTATISTGGVDGAEPATVITQPMTVDPAATTQEIRLSFTDPTKLTAGMLVQVEIMLDQRSNVVVVPPAAIVRREDGTFVMIAGADGLAHRRDVRVGLVTKALVELLSGVTPGDKIIIAGLADVTDGGPIVVDR